MTNFNYKTPEQAYNDIYLQFPKVFITGKKYKELSDGAKIAYMVFKDREEYSLENQWIDENNHIYFNFTIEEIAEMLGKSKPTAIKIKNELEQANLLKQINMGFNRKEMKYYANRLYLANLEVSKSDVYEYDKKARNSKDSQNVDMSESKSSLPTENKKESAENVDVSVGKSSLPTETNESKSSLHNQYNQTHKDFKDNKESTYDAQNTQLKNSIKDNQNQETENEVIDSYINNHSLIDLFGEQIISLMKTYSFSNFNQFKIYTDKLIYSLGSVEKERKKTYLTIDNDELHNELFRAFNRVIIEEKQGNVGNLNNYLFSSLKRVFENFANQEDFNSKTKTNSNQKPVSVINWIEEDNEK